MIITSNSERETERAGAELAQRLRPGDVVALYGGLGAGKTAFVRGLAAGLGVRGRVTSPTYTIVNEYEGRMALFHFDMYRLGSADELFEIGWEEYLSRGGVCAVEWSENIEGALPEDAVKVFLSADGEHTRRIEIMDTILQRDGKQK